MSCNKVGGNKKPFTGGLGGNGKKIGGEGGNGKKIGGEGGNKKPITGGNGKRGFTDAFGSHVGGNLNPLSPSSADGASTNVGGYSSFESQMSDLNTGNQLSSNNNTITVGGKSRRKKSCRRKMKGGKSRGRKSSGSKLSIPKMFNMAGSFFKNKLSKSIKKGGKCRRTKKR
jgi:hypothetical protein